MDIVQKRLSSRTDNIVFDRDKLIQPGLSAPHNRHIFEYGCWALEENGGQTLIRIFKIKCAEVGNWRFYFSLFWGQLSKIGLPHDKGAKILNDRLKPLKVYSTNSLGTTSPKFLLRSIHLCQILSDTITAANHQSDNRLKAPSASRNPLLIVELATDNFENQFL